MEKGSNIPNSPGFEEEGKKGGVGRGWAAHTSADMGKVEKGNNIPNFPGVGKKEGKKGGEKPKGWEENP